MVVAIVIVMTSSRNIAFQRRGLSMLIELTNDAQRPMLQASGNSKRRSDHLN